MFKLKESEQELKFNSFCAIILFLDSVEMKTFIVILLLVACVLSYKDRHELPYGGAILRRNGELIPGKYHYFILILLLFYYNLILFP